MALKIEEYTTVSMKLLRQWQLLWEKSDSAHFFNQPEWFLACTKTFPSKSYRIVVAHENDEAVAFLPLCEERRFGVKALVCPGGKHLSKSTLLVQDNNSAALSAVVNFVSAKGNFCLPEVSHKMANAIKQSNPAIILREASVNPYIPLGDNPLLFLSKNQRSKIFNRMKKNADHLTYRCYKGSSEGLKITFTIDRISSKRKEGKPAFAGGQDKKFFEQLIKNFKEQISVDILFYDNIPIVFGIGFVYKNTYHACNTAYNEIYKSLSPRKLLLYYLLNRLQKEGFKVFDFSRGTNTLKQQFTPLFEKQFDVYYTHSAWLRQWWNFVNYTYKKLLGSKVFYATYLTFKKLFISVNDALTAESFEIKEDIIPGA